MMKTRAVLLLLTLFAATASAAPPDAPPPELGRLKMLAGDMTGTLEELDLKTGQWSSQPIEITGREILLGRYIENRTRFQLSNQSRVSEAWMTWGYDVFKKKYRMSIFDDLAGAMDFFEQVSDEPLTFWDGAGMRLTLRQLEDGKVRMDVDGSRDGGKTWIQVIRVTVSRK